MYFIVGANGYLGSYIVDAALRETDERVIATAREPERAFAASERVSWIKADISDEKGVDDLANELNALERSPTVIFLAAYHHPDAVEQSPEYARKINVDMLSRFMSRAKNVGRFYYASTDSVYGESENLYHFKEGDLKRPVNEYGRQKLAAENVVLERGGNVVRYPFLIGPSLLKHKKHFYDEIVKTLLEGKEIELFADSYRSSLSFAAAARLLIMLTKIPSHPDALNLSGDDDLSKYDVGLMIAEKIGADMNLVKPVKVDETDIFKTKRALSTLLDNSLAKRTLGLDEIRISV